MRFLVRSIEPHIVNSDVRLSHVSSQKDIFGRYQELDFEVCRRRRRIIMAEKEELIELRFRIFDGTDIGHTAYAPSTTIASLKQKLVAEWPQGKKIVPKSVNDVKVIHAGRVLENRRTLADSKITFGNPPGGVITMHVVVQPTITKKRTGKNQEEKQKMNSCSCTIL